MPEMMPNALTLDDFDLSLETVRADYSVVAGKSSPSTCGCGPTAACTQCQC